MAFFLPDGRLVVDNSTLSSLATCGTQAFMQYALNLRAPVGTNLPAEAGSGIHAAIEAYFKTNSRIDAFVALEEYYGHIADAYAQPGDRLSYENIEKCLTGWFDKYGPGELPYVVEPGTVEVPFALPLTKEVVYAGRIDALVRPRGGTGLWLLDTKSTGNPDKKFKAQFKIGSQMSGYYWAAQQLFKEDIEGIYINVVHTGKVPSSYGKCKTHSLPYAECGIWHMKHGIEKFYRSPGEIASWLADAKALATEWYEMLARPFPSLDTIDQRGRWIYQACALCDYHEFCQRGRDPVYACNNFEVRPWVPAGLDESEDLHEINTI